MSNNEIISSSAHGNIISTLSILYAEDDESTRESIFPILSKLFKNVFIAKDGMEALEICLENKDNIDIIVSDINMPKLSGIGMLKEIRKNGLNIPVIFTSAYKEASFLYEAIKLNTSDYLVKPYNVRELFSKIEHLYQEIHHQKILARQKKELTQYLELIDKVAIISKTDTKGRILFVNDIFCEVTGYSKEELLGKSHNIVRHPEMPKEAFKCLWETISQGNVWKGKVKNKSKEGNPYHVNATIIPVFGETENIIGYLGIRFLITQEENEKREFRKKVMDNIKIAKEREIELLNEIKLLQQKQKQFAHLDLINKALDDEKKKTAKLHSQLSYYEDELKETKETMDKFRHEAYNKVTGFNSEIKHLQSLKKILETKFKEKSIDIKVRDEEIKKLKERVEEQNKTILNLKDVVSFREKQLKINNIKL
jgi:PAS domain S-box-containing protein